MNVQQYRVFFFMLISDVFMVSCTCLMCLITILFGGRDDMLHRDIATLDYNMKEIMYIDELTGETINGIVMKIEQVDKNTAFVYVASPYKDENTKQEDNFFFKDIIVFDNRPNEENGWYKDTILANYR